MNKKVFNWTFSQIVKFLNKNGFVYTHVKGSHHYYVGKNNHETRIVTVPFHGSKNIKPRTFKGIVSQSGIPLDKWNV
jgi:predicted RNA binding protein YcfA (HicA-like mRNA interferase family)